jgi:AcrR family transcriptional regulator
MKSEQKIEKNASTEEKIKEAARVVFTRKGYAATRTRDIAEESGYNLALINYYFRSKEKLFDIIMVEHLHLFMQSIVGIVNDRSTTLFEKLEIMVDHYIDMLIANPGLPLFILNEINADPDKLISKVGIGEMTHGELYIITQWKEMAAANNARLLSPLHIFMNLISLTIFPFVACPLIKNRTGISTEKFNELMEERKKLIPVWVKTIIMSSMQQP